MYLTFVSIVIITFLGLMLGVLMTRNKQVAKLIMTLVNFIYTIPSIALFGFVSCITGIGFNSALIADLVLNTD